MTADEVRILIECHRREAELQASQEPPRHEYLARIRREEELKYGPSWSSPVWFGATTNREQARWSRALRRLEEAGLIVRVKQEFGRATMNLHLTDLGNEAVAALQAETTPDPAA